MGTLVSKREDITDQIMAFFSTDKKIGVTQIREIFEKMESASVTRAIVVVQEDITAYAKKILKESAPRNNVEQFQEEELLVNITEHVLVPKHEVLSESEKENLLKR